MTKSESVIRQFKCGLLTVEIYEDAKAAAQAAAEAAAQSLRQLGEREKNFGVIFATGASQIETLRALTEIDGLPWDQVQAFHMDEYIGMPKTHPASFRRYLDENLLQRVPIRDFHAIDGTAPDLAVLCENYTRILKAVNPQLCLLGIGENGHLAFNDPDEADFNDPFDVRVVQLDTPCRVQQAAEGWFGSLEEVPESALTLTIPPLFRVPQLIASVPGSRKAAIVRRALLDPISTACPATILRNHPNATLYLDQESAAQLDDLN